MTIAEAKARVRVQASLPLPLAKRIEESMKVFGLKTMDSAVRQIIEVGLHAIENADRVNSPEKVTELMNQFEEGTLVDYIRKLDQRGLDVLFSIVENERKDRRLGE